MPRETRDPGDPFYTPGVSTPVLATKLLAPVQRPLHVARPRLRELLQTTFESGHRLTVVSAPAGFGKTTLLAEWLTSIAAQQPGTHVAWLHLDDGDNDVPRFLSHLMAALQDVGIAAGSTAAEMLAPNAPTVDLAPLVNHISRAADQAPDAQWVLVLDDYHAITAPAVQEAVSFLVEHAPPHFHLALATRSDPPLPLARLRSRGQLTEVRAADLRFTSSEAGDFLNRVMGLNLTAADVQALDERTEGWVAGLQLAALSLRGIPDHRDVRGFIQAFTGSHRFVIDFLADEVLARQPEPVRDFLLSTAVLDELSGPLCDAVTGRGDGTRMLEDLERDNLFLVPLDPERSWYRYHHLFADVLRARLLSEHPDLVPTLHRRASNWYAAHDHPADAVRHALAAADFDRAAYLMEEALPAVRRTRQDGLLLNWMQSLPDSVVRRRPVLSMLAAWSMLMAGDLDAAARRLDDAEAALAAGGRDQDLAGAWADTEDLRTAPATIEVYRAALAQARADVTGTVGHAQRALDMAGPEDHLVRGAAAGYLGLAAWAAGDVNEALATFTAAVGSLHAAGNLVDELDSTVVLADMWIAAGRPSRARQLYERALRTATADGQPYPRATPDLHVGLADLDRELGDLTAAQSHLETAQTLAQRASISENRYRWFVVMAHVRADQGDCEAALDLLAEAEARYRHGFYPDIRPIPAIRARMHIAQGDLAPAEQWAHASGLPSGDEPAYLREYDNLTYLRLLLARHARMPADPAPLGEALALLDRLESDAEPARNASVVEICLLRALTHQAGDHQSLAREELSRALGRALEPAAHVRLFLDEGTPMLSLLRDAVSDTEPDDRGDLSRHARRLLAAAGASGPATGQSGLPDPLSDRELGVLRLLDSELTGPEIAQQIFVSINTLRTHTKRIYTKLDVNNRAAAVRRGHELGLL